nr:MAG TPA: hypothetical protein [Caudoviricetes sp.]
MRQEGLRPLFCRMRWWDRKHGLRFGNMVKTQCALRGGDEWPMRKTLFRISLHQTKTVKKPRKTAGWAGKRPGLRGAEKEA